MNYEQKQQYYLAWINNMDATATIIRQYLPCIDISLIVEDYAAGPTECEIVKGKCVNCKTWHKRYSTNLCFTCGNLCLICKEVVTTERHMFCKDCANDESKNMIVPFLRTFTNDKVHHKSKLYVEWYHVTFPSDVHKRHLARLKAEAPVRAEKKRQEDEFLAQQRQINPIVLAGDLKLKLYQLNATVNAYIDAHPGCGLPRQPVYPYW